MCRFVLYRGPALRLSTLVTEPTNSLIRQSFHSREQEDPVNGDGFGLAWYAPEVHDEPALFRSVTPAWNNQNLLELARVVRSSLVFAHVRAATKHGGQSEANCHPFRSGRHVFMHNGDVGDFAHLRRPLLESLSDPAFDTIAGTTDSEHVFGLVVDELAKAKGKGADRLSAALQRAIARVQALSEKYGSGKPSYLNMALSDGEFAVACRFTNHEGYDGESLFVHTGRLYVCDGNVCRMLAPERGHGCVLVSSEPLSDDQGWNMMPRNSLVRVGERGDAEVAPLSL